jgi:hypothetical protein
MMGWAGPWLAPAEIELTSESYDWDVYFQVCEFAPWGPDLRDTRSLMIMFLLIIRASIDLPIRAVRLSEPGL